ncbi:MAG TPA: hypothetical protein PLY53_15845, partial [Planctomycetota bacterium]|nr:hypothetical protein [Planctomycetota bacterium]
LDGGTPAEIDAEKAKVEAQRKKQEERDEIAKKAAAPLKGDMGDTTPPLPGMEGVAPDDLELLNQKPKEAQNADQERGAKEVAGGKQARGAEADGGGDAQGSKAAGTAGKPEGEGLQERAVEVAAKNAEVEFDTVPKKGQYVEIPGLLIGGKRTYLSQSWRGNAKVFYVPSGHHGKVLNGMAALMRVKGRSDIISAVRMIGGGKAPAGSEQWGVSEWSSYNQKIVNRHKEGAKAAPKAPITPKSDTKPAESPTIEPPKVEAPPAPPPKQKKRFSSEAELVAYLDANPEAASWTEEDFEIVADETQPAEEVVAPVSEAPAAPAKAEFVPPLKKIGENNVAYKRRTEALRKEWEAAQA